MTTDSHPLDANRIAETTLDSGDSNTIVARQKILWTPAWSLAVIVGCLTASFLLKVMFISGPSHGSDDVRYLRSASAMLGLQSVDVLDHAASRLAFLLVTVMPAVIAGKAFFGALVNVIVCLAAELLAVRFVYLSLGLSAAALCAAFVAFSGLSLTYAGTITPDPLLMLFYLVSGIALYHAVSAEGRGRVSMAAWAGLAAGLAYSVKDTGILLLVPGVFCLAVLPWPMSSYRARVVAVTVFMAAFAFVWLLESLVLFAITGDFFYRINAISEIHNASVGESESLLAFLRSGWWSLHDAVTNTGLLMIPAIAALVGWIWMLRPKTSWPVFALIGFFTAGFLFFGTSSLSRLINLPYQERYLMLLFPFIGIGIAFAFARTKTRSVKAALVVAVGLNALFAVPSAARKVGDLYFEPFLRDSATVATILMQLKDGPVFVDERTHEGLRHFLPEESLAALKPIPPEGPLPEGYYILYPVKPRTDEQRARYDQVLSLPSAFHHGQSHSFMARFDPFAYEPKYRVSVHVNEAE